MQDTITQLQAERSDSGCISPPASTRQSSGGWDWTASERVWGYAHHYCLHKINSIGWPCAFDSRIPSCRLFGREILLCLQSRVGIWCCSRQERMLLWLNTGQGGLRCDALSIQVTCDDKPVPHLQQQSLRYYVPADTVVGCRDWPQLAIHWCHWQRKRTDRLFPVSQLSLEVFWKTLPAAQSATGMLFVTWGYHRIIE